MEGSLYKVVIKACFENSKSTTQKRNKLITEDKIVSNYPHLWKLRLVGVERDEDLISQLVTEVLPEHLHVLRLHVDQVVTRPLRLVDLSQ